MPLSLAIVMDPIESIHFKKDSSLAMLWAAADKGWRLFYIQQHELYISNGEARAKTQSLQVFRDPERWFELQAEEDQALGDIDIILMRKDPPFDNEYLYSTYLLEMAERAGCLVVNPAQALRDNNEKITATLFPECCPPHLVSADDAQIRQFYADHKDIILKPLDGMGGSSIFRVKPEDNNLGVIIETLTLFGQRTIMAQKYVPEIVDGDKRILLIDGEPIPYCLARVPSQGETRGNLAAGGRGEARELSARDRWICDKLKAYLKESGLFFVGIDVIGDYLTEVNVTSPTCIREIDAAYDTNIAGRLMDRIEQEINSRR